MAVNDQRKLIVGKIGVAGLELIEGNVDSTKVNKRSFIVPSHVEEAKLFSLFLPLGNFFCVDFHYFFPMLISILFRMTESAGMLSVIQVFPPMTEPLPITVSPPRIVELA